MKEQIRRYIPERVLDWYHAVWAFLGVVVYRNPSHHIRVIGITGTNGKTSTTHIASDILEMCGLKVGSLSSLRFKIGGNEEQNLFKMTMPGRMHIQRMMRQAVNAECDVFVMEVTSEGIKQNRHRGIRFDTVVFLNLTPEHIERHGSFDAYKKTKAKLFARTQHRVAIINADDPHADYFSSFPCEKVVCYTATDVNREDVSMVRAHNVSAQRDGIAFEIDNVAFRAQLLGVFNVSNSLAAISICLEQGVVLENISSIFPAIHGIDGRAEIVLNEPRVIVDYAHTPDGLEKIYAMAKTVQGDGGKKVCVLGSAGGGRDKWKRPEMGKIAEQECDEIILTDEDPYDEDPEKIIEEVRKGISDQEKVSVVLDRREAIHKALARSNKQDTVVITGKGAEPWMVTKQGKIPWDDRKIVREEWEKIEHDTYI